MLNLTLGACGMTLMGTQDLGGEVPPGSQVPPGQGRGHDGQGLPLPPAHKGESHISQTAGEIILNQDVGTLDIPVSDRGFSLEAHQGYMEVGQSRARCRSHSEKVSQRECASSPSPSPSLFPIAGSHEVIEGPMWVVASDQPVLVAAIKAVGVRGNKANDGLVVHAQVEDLGLVEPRVHPCAEEPLHGHGLLLVAAQGHLAKATVAQADVLQIDPPGKGALDEVRLAQSAARRDGVHDRAVIPDIAKGGGGGRGESVKLNEDDMQSCKWRPPSPTSCNAACITSILSSVPSTSSLPLPPFLLSPIPHKQCNP